MTMVRIGTDGWTHFTTDVNQNWEAIGPALEDYFADASDRWLAVRVRRRGDGQTVTVPVARRLYADTRVHILPHVFKKADRLWKANRV